MIFNDYKYVPSLENAISKLPALTLGFWVIKILAGSLGGTAGDTLSLSMNLGYLLSTLMLAVFFFVAVIAQIKAVIFIRFCIGALSLPLLLEEQPWQTWRHVL